MALSVAAVSTQAMGVALATDIGSASTIEFRTGTKPATPETAATGTLLATVAVTGSFTSTGGVLTAADPASVSVVATGTPGYFRVKTSGGTAKVDGTVTDNGGNGDAKFANISWIAGGNVDIGVPTLTVPVS